MKLRLIACVAPLAVLAACSGGSDGEAEADQMDPASEQALNDELMTDPDLANRNEANAALSGTGNSAVPNIDTSSRAIDAARTRAAEMVGGRDELVNPGQPRRLSGNETVTATMRQAATRMQGSDNCFSDVQYTTAWAARLPAEFPVYPRGNTMEAAGTDDGNCAIRVVTFRTPVPLEEVMAFYYTRAQGAGYDAEYVQVENEHVLSGTNGQAAFTIYGRRKGQNLTEIDLTTSKP